MFLQWQLPPTAILNEIKRSNRRSNEPLHLYLMTYIA